MRDVPGIIEPQIFKKPGFGGLRHIHFSSTSESIHISYEHEDVEVSGFDSEDIVQMKFLFKIDINSHNFSLKYTVNEELRLEILPGSFMFETSQDANLIKLLLDHSKNDKFKVYERLFESTHQSYKFKEYVEEIPHGPSGMSVTFEFFKSERSTFTPKLMGICDRMVDTLDLQPTIEYETKERITEPHRVYNTDHFNDEYPQVGLYGSCPLLYTIENAEVRAKIDNL